MQEITILPIFDQSAPGVWRDFACICAETMYSNYNNRSYFEEIDDWVHQDAANWKLRRAKFAFGAYDNRKMVGYIQGYAVQRCAWVDSLYLLSEYQGRGVGKFLLHHAEMAVTNISKRIELTSLSGAMDFYESQGYSIRCGENHYYKNLKGPIRTGTVPVFHVYASLAHACQDVNPRFNAATVNVHHAPMFAHFDVDGRLDGYIGAGACAPQMRVAAPDFAKKVLQNCFDRYMQFYQNQK